MSRTTLQKPSKAARYQKLIDKSPDVICAIDKEGFFTEVSNACYPMWGYTPQELVGSPLLSLLQPAEKKKILALYPQLQDGRIISDIVTQLIGKSGALVPVTWSAHWDAEDEVVYAIARNAQKSLQAEKELQLQRRQLQQVHQIARLGSWEYSYVAGKAMWLSDELYDIYGINKAELPEITTQFFFNHVHPEDLTYVRHTIGNVSYHSTNHLKHRFVRKDGKVIHLKHRIEPLYDNNTVVGLRGIVQDITDQTEAANRASMNEKRYRSMVHYAYDIVSIVDMKGNYQYISDSIYRILGYTPEELIGSNALTLIHDQDKKRVKAALDRLRTKPYVDDLEPFRYKSKCGKWLWIEATGANMIDDPAVQGIVINSRDVTEKIKLQENLEKEMANRQRQITSAAIQAQERERSQLGLELHDNVNQVLTTVKLYMELYLSSVVEDRSILSKAVDHLQNSINEIRSISKRLSAPTLGAITIKDSLQELVDSINFTKKIDIDLAINDLESCSISQDIHLSLYRIIQEQLNNIIKHAQATKAWIVLQRDAEHLQLTIKDNGKGFNAASKRNGIGLTNIASRVESMKGKLFIMTSEGNGFLLRVLLPVEISCE